MTSFQPGTLQGGPEGDKTKKTEEGEENREEAIAAGVRIATVASLKRRRIERSRKVGRRSRRLTPNQTPTRILKEKKTTEGRRSKSMTPQVRMKRNC